MASLGLSVSQVVSLSHPVMSVFVLTMLVIYLLSHLLLFGCSAIIPKPVWSLLHPVLSVSSPVIETFRLNHGVFLYVCKMLLSSASSSGHGNSSARPKNLSHHSYPVIVMLVDLSAHCSSSSSMMSDPVLYCTRSLIESRTLLFCRCFLLAWMASASWSGLTPVLFLTTLSIFCLPFLLLVRAALLALIR